MSGVGIVGSLGTEGLGWCLIRLECRVRLDRRNGDGECKARVEVEEGDIWVKDGERIGKGGTYVES